MENKKILIIVDMQNDFITGSLANPDAEKIVDPICEYIKENKENLCEIILTRDTHRSNYLETQEGKNLPVEHCVNGTAGWCVHDKIQKTFRDLKLRYNYIDKNNFGFPYWRDLHELTGWEDADIEICGTCTDICVISNALIIKSQFPERKVRILSKLCAGLTPELHEAALKVMKSCQCEIV